MESATTASSVPPAAATTASVVPPAAATTDDNLQSSDSSSPADAVNRLIHAVSQRQQHLLDKTVPHVLYRWIACLCVVLIYFVRVYLVEGFYIITYAIGIYLLNLIIAFLSPQEDPEASLTTGGTLPTRRSDEYRPFVRRLPEFKFWFVSLIFPNSVQWIVRSDHLGFWLQMSRLLCLSKWSLMTYLLRNSTIVDFDIARLIQFCREFIYICSKI